MSITVPIIKSGQSYIAVIEGDLVEDDHQEGILHLLREIYLATTRMKMATTKVVLINSLFALKHEVPFFQYVPSRDDYDSSGNCGNGLLAAYAYVQQKNQMPGLAEVRSIHSNLLIRIKNYKREWGSSYNIIAELEAPESRQNELLPLGKAVIDVDTELGNIDISVINSSNVYVWVESSVISDHNLMQWGQAEHRILSQIRKQVQRELGIHDGSVFPKIAAFSKLSNQSIASRMISVDDWHPSFATTGLLNMSAALQTEGSLLHRYYQNEKDITIHVPGHVIKPSIQSNCIVIEQTIQYCGGVQVDYKKKHLV